MYEQTSTSLMDRKPYINGSMQCLSWFEIIRSCCCYCRI